MIALENRRAVESKVIATANKTIEDWGLDLPGELQIVIGHADRRPVDGELPPAPRAGRIGHLFG